MSKSKIEITKEYYQAYIDSNRDLIENNIAHEFVFTSPYDNQINRKIYFEHCWPSHEFVIDYTFINIFEKDDKVFVTYIATWNDGRKFQNTEILKFKTHLITEIEVYFGWSIPHEAKIGNFINHINK